MDDYIDAHKFCTKHKAEIINDKKCGCFYCLSIFPPKEIDFWLEEGSGTAICPYCRIDSVIGESSGYAITKEFLQKMHDHWFSM